MGNYFSFKHVSLKTIDHLLMISFLLLFSNFLNFDFKSNGRLYNTSPKFCILVQVKYTLLNVSNIHIMSKWSIVFNETCLKENLLPIYSNIYICICFNRSTQYVDSFCAAVVIHNTGDASEPFAKSFKRLFFELF